MFFITVLYVSIQWVLFFFFSFRCKKPTGWRGKQPSNSEEKLGFRVQPKPPWVRKEVIRLKALMPDDGCRKIALTFNRLHRREKKETVGKTFVSRVIRNHQYEIQVLRNKIKHRKPAIIPKRIIWQVDLTGKPTDENRQQMLLGIIDHGCRACVALATLPRKSTLRILIQLLQAIERFGTPRTIRTDNETMFTSLLFRLVMWLLGIKHQQTELHCPWQNGRIERLFLTLKQKLNQLEFTNADSLDLFLQRFRFWYNFVRPHQHLNGKVPAEVWMKRTFSARKASWCEDETGLLRGYYLPPS